MPTRTPDTRPDPQPRVVKPLDPPMVPIVIAGMVVWAVVGLILLAIRSDLEASGRENWITICLYGVLVAVPGLLLMIRHDANRRRRRSQSEPARNG